MRVLVTGGTGFIGYHLVNTLLQLNHEVTCLIRETSNIRWLESLGDPEYVYGELRNPDSLTAAVEQKDWIFHLAGIVTGVNRAHYIEVNQGGTRNLIQATARQNSGLQKFVFVSSQSAGGPTTPSRPKTEDMPDKPVTHYGESKLLAEETVLEYANTIPVSIVRPPVAYGPLDVGVQIFFQLVARGWQVKFTGPEFYLSLIYVEDLVEALLQVAAHTRATGERFYVSDNVRYSMTEIQDTIAQVMEISTHTVPLPRKLLYVPAVISECFIKLLRKPSFLNYQKIKEMTQPAWLCSAEKLQRRTGFQPQYTLSSGARKTVDWYRTHGWI
ncbi:MAG TPA: NAD(P)-dependent oxidoreductase [bacterium]|nr:NAD(P)-dependent oxidoreductase [bacterium]